jgi:hypothetical protein
VGLRGRVERGPANARLHAGRARGGVYGDALHRGQVDHETAVADRRAGRVVIAAAHGHEQPVRSREIHGSAHVGRVDAPGDEARPAVDHAVPDAASVVVAGRAGR